MGRTGKFLAPHHSEIRAWGWMPDEPFFRASMGKFIVGGTCGLLLIFVVVPSFLTQACWKFRMPATLYRYFRGINNA